MASDCRTRRGKSAHPTPRRELCSSGTRKFCPRAQGGRAAGTRKFDTLLLTELYTFKKKYPGTRPQTVIGGGHTLQSIVRAAPQNGGCCQEAATSFCGICAHIHKDKDTAWNRHAQENTADTCRSQRHGRVCVCLCVCVCV